MATTSLIINTKDSNDKALQKTITNVNAACSSGTLKTFSQMLNGLTSNNYVKTDRVDKSNVDTATDKTVPAASQLIVKSKTSQVTVSAANEFTATLTSASFDGSTNVSVTANNVGASYLGRPYFDNLTSTNQSGVVAATPATCYIGSSSWTIPISLGSTDANQTIGADLIYPAIGDYVSNTQHVTVIITEG